MMRTFLLCLALLLPATAFPSQGPEPYKLVRTVKEKKSLKRDGKLIAGVATWLGFGTGLFLMTIPALGIVFVGGVALMVGIPVAKGGFRRIVRAGGGK